MMSIKLALRNVKKSFRDYTIYFLTLTFGVCIFYLFNALESQQTIMRVTEGQAALFQELGRIMGGISIFVSVILGFLIVYANRFLIRRRKKEFGVYLTLGIDRGMVSRILIIETLFVGVFSLIAGIALGVICSQGMAYVTAGLLKTTITNFHFMFSIDVALKTCVYFGLIFLLVLIFNTITIGKLKLIDLLYADRKSESFKAPHLALSVVIFIVSVACLIYAYGSVLSNGLAAIFDDNTLLLAIVLGVAGTFLFFYSLSGFFLRLIRQNKKLYLKNLNMFVLRQLSSKMNTTFVSMTFVCLMLFISICTLSSGMGLSLDIASGMEKSTPFDASLVVRGALDESDTPLAPIQGYDLATDAKDVGLDNFAKDYLAVRYYQSDLVVPLTVFENNIKQEYNMQSYFLKLSDYNAILKRAGAAPIALAPGEYAVNSEVTNEAFHTAVADYMKNPEEIELNGAKLRSSSQNFYTNFMETSRYQDYNMTMIVPDEFVKDLPVVQNVLHINYPEQTAEYDALCKEGLSKLQFDRGVQAVTQTRSEVTEVGDSATTIIIYLGVYLGIIFLIAAAAVLAIGQLSETSDNVSRYSLLRKIGADEKMINRAMFSQILIYFGAPMILAIVHSMVGIPVAGQIVSAFDKGNIFGGSLFTACVLLVIYGGYFWSTYQGSKRILNRDYR